MLEQAYNQSHPQLIILGIDEGDGQKDLDDFIRLINITFPVVVDQDKKLMQQLGVQGYPTSFFIDQDGILQVIEIGQMSEKSFTNNLNKIGIYP
jgi:protein-disulfide isomerase-like protein with CxxC motif